MDFVIFYKGLMPLDAPFFDVCSSQKNIFYNIERRMDRFSGHQGASGYCIFLHGSNPDTRFTQQRSVSKITHV